MDCDPILAAGYRYCTPCRAETYPDDAAWVGDDLILASYPPLCRHDPHARVQLIVPSALGVAAACCAGLTASGARCRHRPRPGGPYCWQHGCWAGIPGTGRCPSPMAPGSDYCPQHEPGRVPDGSA